MVPTPLSLLNNDDDEPNIPFVDRPCAKLLTALKDKHTRYSRKRTPMSKLTVNETMNMLERDIVTAVQERCRIIKEGTTIYNTYTIRLLINLIQTNFNDYKLYGIFFKKSNKVKICYNILYS